MKVVVDVEFDGPAVGLYSMVCFGAVIVSPELDKTFYGQTKPITDNYLEKALAVSGFSREQHESFPEPAETMYQFRDWLAKHCKEGRPVFISDNPAADWQWINYYFHRYLGSNPFGFSARRIGDLYSGMVGNMRASSKWKKYRKTRHTHNPLDDAMGNAEALLWMFENGLNP